MLILSHSKSNLVSPQCYFLECAMLQLKFFTLTLQVRKVVKLFRRSPVKNDQYLQKHVKENNNGQELKLLLDSKTRWSSLLFMIERFVRITKSVRLALIDMQSDICFCDQ